MYCALVFKIVREKRKVGMVTRMLCVETQTVCFARVLGRQLRARGWGRGRGTYDLTSWQVTKALDDKADLPFLRTMPRMVELLGKIKFAVEVICTQCIKKEVRESDESEYSARMV
jgi:hypothetical protein